MSAVSAPRPDAPEPGTDADGWALLESLRRRLDDQAALQRSTQAQVGQLAESIAGLVAQQRRRSLWLNVNSFVAYLVFTVLCGAGSYLLYRSRASELTAARDLAIRERDAAVRRADDAAVHAGARAEADAAAWDVYQLLEAGKRGEATARLEALRDRPLSRTERAALAARAQETRAERTADVDGVVKAAAAAFKAGRPADLADRVIKPLEAALAGEPGARAPEIHYYLGLAYARTEPARALPHLQAAVAGDVAHADARFQLASVLDRTGAYGAARGEYDRFATAYPQSALAGFATRRSAALARLPAVAGRAAAPPAPASPGAGSAAPAAPPVAQPRPASAPVTPVPGASSEAAGPVNAADPANRGAGADHTGQPPASESGAAGAGGPPAGP